MESFNPNNPLLENKETELLPEIPVEENPQDDVIEESHEKQSRLRRGFASIGAIILSTGIALGNVENAQALPKYEDVGVLPTDKQELVAQNYNYYDDYHEQRESDRSRLRAYAIEDKSNQFAELYEVVLYEFKVDPETFEAIKANIESQGGILMRGLTPPICPGDHTKDRKFDTLISGEGCVFQVKDEATLNKIKDYLTGLGYEPLTRADNNSR